MARERGLILVDTKYEFGKKDGKIYLIDEIHTPDSSRYFYAEGYEERFERGEEQKQLSKEFVRQWLIKNGFQGRDGEVVPEMTEEYCKSVSDRYIELYETVTGLPSSPNPPTISRHASSATSSLPSSKLRLSSPPYKRQRPMILIGYGALLYRNVRGKSGGKGTKE